MRLCLSLVAFGAVAASSAAALDLPARKPGLWELKTVHENANMPPQTMQQCTDAATDKMMATMGTSLASGLCQKQDTRQVGGTFVIDATCKMGPMTVRSRSVISGDFSSAYTIKVTSKVEGGPPMVQQMAGGTNVTEARWIGACKPGQKPGDIVMADGRTMNIMNLKGMLGGGGR